MMKLLVCRSYIKKNSAKIKPAVNGIYHYNDDFYHQSWFRVGPALASSSSHFFGRTLLYNQMKYEIKSILTN